MSFSAYSRGYKAAHDARNLRPLLYNPNYPVTSFFMALFVGLGVTFAVWVGGAWLGYGTFDIQLMKKPIAYQICVFPILFAWGVEASRYRKATRNVSDIMIDPDQPAEKTT